MLGAMLRIGGLDRLDKWTLARLSPRARCARFRRAVGAAGARRQLHSSRSPGFVSPAYDGRKVVQERVGLADDFVNRCQQRGQRIRKLGGRDDDWRRDAELADVANERLTTLLVRVEVEDQRGDITIFVNPPPCACQAPLAGDYGVRADAAKGKC